MSKSMLASVEAVRIDSAVLEQPSSIKLEGDLAVRLFENNSVEFQEPAAIGEEGGDDAEYDMKEDSSTTVVADPSSSRSASADVKPSPSPDVEGDDHSPAPLLTDSKPKMKKAKYEPQLIGHLPRAEEEAMKHFIEIQDNHYQYSTLGRSREALESMTCDCQYEHGVDDPEDACGQESDCINRLTQVECMPDDCRCGGYCQNQRFQRKQYAPIHIVQTEKKGFGLRAAEDLRKDTFIYEYVGDVVSQPSFLKRMRQYAEEGIRHFYFMMLQKDEYIDATKRGGIGRFANHSCNPNCYVAKWTVGDKVRMGIFAHRDIKKDEELTFNYNVDRYGHEAQPCYCGEAKCVGYIGGKTQTDLAAMDDLYLDALGIADEVERLNLKGNKKKRSKKLDEDFVPELKPLLLKDVPKVVQAMRQTQSRKVLLKLLTRIKITDDQSALRQIMRLRGFSVMSNVLDDYAADVEICSVAIDCMMTWPLIQRNKVEDSKVNVPVKACSQSENVVLAERAVKLLAQWDTLEYAYRIPKRAKEEGDCDNQPPSSMPLYDDHEDWRPPKRARHYANIDEPRLDIKPLGKFGRLAVTEATVPKMQMFDSDWVPPEVHGKLAELRSKPYNPAPSAGETRNQLDRIIAEAAAAAEAERVRAADEAAAAVAAAQAAAQKKGVKHKKLTPEEKEANKEKRLLKLVGAVVVKCMSKYQDQMDHDVFKKHAKELTSIIAEKEKKSHSYKENKLDALSDEKVAKIKKFSKEYIAKILRKLEKSGQRRKTSASASNAGASTSTAHSPRLDAAGSPHHDVQHSPDDAMDLDDRDLADSHMNGDQTHESPYGSPDHSWSRDRSRSPEPYRRDVRWNGRRESATYDASSVRSRDEYMDVDHGRNGWPVSPNDSQRDSRDRWDRPRGKGHSEAGKLDVDRRDYVQGDPRLRHRKEEFGWDPDHGGAPRRSLLERLQPL